MTTLTRRHLTEHAMQIAELSFPAHAAKSGHEAYKDTLSRTGAVVIKTSAGQMVERRADGTSHFIKQIPLGKRVKPGIILKRAKQAG